MSAKYFLYINNGQDWEIDVKSSTLTKALKWKKAISTHQHWPSLTVDIIGKSRMIAIQFGAIRQNLIGKSIQITDAPRKPWHRRRIILVIARDNAEIAAAQFQFVDRIAQAARTTVTLHKEFVAWAASRRTRFNMNQVHVVVVEYFQELSQRTGRQIIFQWENDACIFCLLRVGVLHNVRWAFL